MTTGATCGRIGIMKKGEATSRGGALAAKIAGALALKISGEFRRALAMSSAQAHYSKRHDGRPQGQDLGAQLPRGQLACPRAQRVIDVVVIVLCDSSLCPNPASNLL